MEAARRPFVPEFASIRCSAMIWRRYRIVSITALTVLVAGGLLLMHGLDTHGSQMQPVAVSEVSAVDGHGGHGVDHHDDDGSHCDGCMAGAAMAACVAVIMVFESWSLIRRVLGASRSTPLLMSGLDRVRRAVDVFRPPGPVWIRLSVMRC